MIIEKIPKKIIDSLITFHNKYRLISKTKFVKYFQSQQGLNLHQVVYPQLKSGKISLNEPSEDIIDAFILHFRQFHLTRDVTSIEYLKGNVINEIPDEFNNQKSKLKSYIKEFENSLQKKPFIELNIHVNGKKFNLNNHKDFIDTMIYGGKIHSSPDSKERLYYDYFHKNSNEGFKPITKRYFRFNVYSIILEELSILGLIYIEINSILLKIIDYFRKRGEELLLKSNFDSSIKNYKNAIYISNQLEFQRKKAQLLEELLQVYKKLNSQEEIIKLKSEIQNIKNALNEFPCDFYEDPFFKDYFQTPIEFEEFFNKVLPDIGLNDKPIIILTPERINDLKKLEKHLNMKYFSYEVENNILKISYSLAIAKSNKSTLYIDKKEDINLKHEFGLTFAFPDLSCFIILTNDPKMALLNYIYMRGNSSLDPLTHLYMNKLTEFLIALMKIELNIISKRPKFKSKEDIFRGELDFDFLLNFSPQIIRILKKFVQISYFPRILRKVDLDTQIINLKRLIENDIDKKFKGQALFSLGLSAYLYTILTNDNKYLEKLSKLKPLIKILDLIKGKDLKNDFYHALLDYLDRNFHIFR